MMAKTILNLNLIYRGKHLDTIRQGSDFVNHWFIGSDKHLFWQILDDDQKFPAKHKFLIKRGNDYYLQLPSGSSLTCSKDGNQLDANFLKQNGILSGSLLKMRQDLSGTVQVHPDYEIQFGHAEPLLSVLRPNEQAVVNSSLHAAPLSSSERTEVGIILLFLILGLAFVLIYDQVIKPKMEKDKNLSEIMAELERVRRIEPQLGLTPTPGAETTEPETPAEGEEGDVEEQPGEEPDRTPARTTRRTPGSRTGRQDQGTPDSRQIFGARTPGVTSGNVPATAYAVTGLQDFVTARPGQKAGSGATGATAGPGTFGPRASSGYPATFDPANSGFNTSGNIGRVAEVQPGQPGSTTRPNIPTRTFTGDASRLETPSTSQWPSVPSAQQQARQVTENVVRTPEITKETVPEVRIPKPASSVPEADIIYNQIASRRGQIEQSYKRNAAIKQQTGSITVLLDIAENGSVSANISSNSATFTQSFLNEIKSIVESWRFSVTKPTKYQFTMRLTQA